MIARRFAFGLAVVAAGALASGCGEDDASSDDSASDTPAPGAASQAAPAVGADDGAAASGGAGGGGGLATGSTAAAPEAVSVAGAGLPSGVATSCYGQACPFGACDNDLVLADTACLIPTIKPEQLCGPTQSSAYCLTMSNTNSWRVTCATGMPTTETCANGCTASLGAATCN